MRLVVLVVVLLAAVRIHAEPCAPPSTEVPGPLALPAEGAVVPTNAIVVLHSVDASRVVEVIAESAGPVEVERSALLVDDGFDSLVGYTVLRPVLGFAAGDAVRVQLDGTPIVSFTVGEEADVVAAAAPTSVAFREPYQNGACVPYSRIGADVAEDVVALLAAPDGVEPALAEGMAGFGVGDSVVVAGSAGTTARFKVAALDAAGNVSAAVEVDVPFRAAPPRPRGCDGSVAPGLLLPLLLRRRRT